MGLTPDLEGSLEGQGCYSSPCTEDVGARLVSLVSINSSYA